MSRSVVITQEYFDASKESFSVNQYTIAERMESGIPQKQKCNQSPIFFELLQQSIDSPGMLTPTQQGYVIDYLQYLS